MVVGGLITLLAVIICILGGNNADVTQLYYDADFVELYDTSEEDGSSGEREFKGGQRLEKESPAIAVPAADNVATTIAAIEKKEELAIDPDDIVIEEAPLESLPPLGQANRSGVDNKMLARDIYESVEL